MSLRELGEALISAARAEQKLSDLRSLRQRYFILLGDAYEKDKYAERGEHALKVKADYIEAFEKILR